MPNRARRSLEQIPLFEGLSAAELEHLRNRIQQRRIPAKTALLTQDARGEGIFFLLSGTVKIYRERADGTAIVLNMVGPGEAIGEISALDGGGHTAHAVTLEPTLVLWIGADEFVACMSSIPQLSQNVVRLLTHRLRLSSAHIEALSTLNVHCRVSRLLWGLAQRYKEDPAHAVSAASSPATPSSPASSSSSHQLAMLIPVRLTQGDIAAMVGASRAHVNKSLAQLRRQKVIEVRSDQRILVLDEMALSHSCD